RLINSLTRRLELHRSLCRGLGEMPVHSMCASSRHFRATCGIFLPNRGRSCPFDLHTYGRRLVRNVLNMRRISTIMSYAELGIINERGQEVLRLPAAQITLRG